MSNIYEFIQKSNNCRPVYTSYELSKMVRNKRKEEETDCNSFALRYNLNIKLLQEIEQGQCSFSPRHYKACCNILGLSYEEILKEYDDSKECVNFRTCGSERETEKTFDVANMLFNEIIMQEKIGTK